MENVILLIDRGLTERWNFSHFPIIVFEFCFEANVYVKKWASFLIDGHADFADIRRILWFKSVSISMVVLAIFCK